MLIEAETVVGLDGTLDVLSTDHAPHAPEKKLRELDQAPNGIIGLETFLPICIKALIEPGVLTWPQMLTKMTINPARVLGIDRGTLKPGAPADVTIIGTGALQAAISIATSLACEPLESRRYSVTFRT